MNLFAPKASGNLLTKNGFAGHTCNNSFAVTTNRALASQQRAWTKFLLLLCSCFFILFKAGAAATGNVTLAWDPPVNGTVAEFKVYYGTSSQAYSGSVSAGTSTKATMTGLIPGTTYYFVTTDLDSKGTESIFSNEVSYKVPSTNPAPFLSLTFPATGGVINSPFITNNGALYQTSTTDLNSGGRAVYYFQIADAGDYTLSGLVSGPNNSSNAFFVNIDAEPTGGNLWNFSKTSGFANQTVTWPGVSPKVFTLSAGVHQLIVRGRDANVQLKSISLVPVLARLQLTVTPTKQAVLSGTGRPSHTYQVQYSQNLMSWNVLGNVKTDSTGAWQYTDPSPATAVNRSYRLRE